MQLSAFADYSLRVLIYVGLDPSHGAARQSAGPISLMAAAAPSISDSRL
jgi:hypothetical protein